MNKLQLHETSYNSTNQIRRQGQEEQEKENSNNQNKFIFQNEQFGKHYKYRSLDQLGRKNRNPIEFEKQKIKRIIEHEKMNKFKMSQPSIRVDDLLTETNKMKVERNKQMNIINNRYMSLRNSKRQQNFILENVEEMQYGNVVKPYFTDKKEQKVIYPKDQIQMIKELIKGAIAVRREKWDSDCYDISKYNIDTTLLNQSQYVNHRRLMTQLGLLNDSVQMMEKDRTEQTDQQLIQINEYLNLMEENQNQNQGQNQQKMQQLLGYIPIQQREMLIKITNTYQKVREIENNGGIDGGKGEQQGLVFSPKKRQTFVEIMNQQKKGKDWKLVDLNQLLYNKNNPNIGQSNRQDFSSKQIKHNYHLLKKKVEGYVDQKLDSDNSEDEWQFKKFKVQRYVTEERQQKKIKVKKVKKGSDMQKKVEKKQYRRQEKKVQKEEKVEQKIEYQDKDDISQIEEINQMDVMSESDNDIGLELMKDQQIQKERQLQVRIEQQRQEIIKDEELKVQYQIEEQRQQEIERQRKEQEEFRERVRLMEEERQRKKEEKQRKNEEEELRKERERQRMLDIKEREMQLKYEQEEEQRRQLELARRLKEEEQIRLKQEEEEEQRRLKEEQRRLKEEERLRKEEERQKREEERLRKEEEKLRKRMEQEEQKRKKKEEQDRIKRQKEEQKRKKLEEERLKKKREQELEEEKRREQDRIRREQEMLEQQKRREQEELQRQMELQRKKEEIDIFNYDKQKYKCALLHLQDSIDKKLGEKDFKGDFDVMIEIQKYRKIKMQQKKDIDKLMKQRIDEIEVEEEECEQEIEKLEKMKEQWEKVQLQKMKNKHFNKDIEMSLKLSNNLNNYVIENSDKKDKEGGRKTMGFRQKQFENIDIKKIEERKNFFQEEQTHLGKIRKVAVKQETQESESNHMDLRYAQNSINTHDTIDYQPQRNNPHFMKALNKPNYIT